MKYIKNDSGVTNSWVGKELSNGEVYVIPDYNGERWAKAALESGSDVETDILSGDLKVSQDNFVTTLSATDGLYFIIGNDADCIQGILIKDLAPNDNDIIKYDSATHRFEYVADEDTTDHTALSNIGTNNHAAIDTHIADATIHYTQASISIPASQISDFDTEVSNNTSVTANTAKVSFPEAPVDGEQYTRKDGAWDQVAIPDGNKTAEDINQSAHGLVVGNVIRHNGTSYVKAQADTQDNSEAIGIVSAVEDANNFTVTYSGRIDGLSGLTAGQVYFLSTSTAGALASVEPGLTKPIIQATSATSGVIIIMRGIEAVLSVIPPANNFGTYYESKLENAQTQTTSATFVAKLSHTTQVLPSANYYISYCFELGVDTNAVVCEAEVNVGGNIIGTPTFEADGDYHAMAGFCDLNLSGAVLCEIKYKSGDGVAAVQMRKARIAIWRIS